MVQHSYILHRLYATVEAISPLGNVNKSKGYKTSHLITATSGGNEHDLNIILISNEFESPEYHLTFCTYFHLSLFRNLTCTLGWAIASTHSSLLHSIPSHSSLSPSCPLLPPSFSLSLSLHLFSPFTSTLSSSYSLVSWCASSHLRQQRITRSGL